MRSSLRQLPPRKGTRTSAVTPVNEADRIMFHQLRIKIGEHEFEATGPEGFIVNALGLFEDFIKEIDHGHQTEAEGSPEPVA